MEYYKESSEDFKSFLGQCKRAMDKCLLAFGSVKQEQWSALYGNNGYDQSGNFPSFKESRKHGIMEVWEGLKKYGTYQFNCNGIAIDFDFGRVVYAEIKD